MNAEASHSQHDDVIATVTVEVLPAASAAHYAPIRVSGTSLSVLHFNSDPRVTASTNMLAMMRHEILEGVREGLEDLVHGRVSPIEELWDSIGNE